MILAVKTLHVLAVIAWMAGLLYLPRLFVYHSEVAVEGEASAVFEVMERRLFFAIMTPAMVVAWVSGLYLAIVAFGFAGGWLHAKIALVVAMTIHHFYQDRWRKAFAAGENRHSQRFFRVQNEVPTLLLIGIVALVIVKPF